MTYDPTETGLGPHLDSAQRWTTTDPDLRHVDRGDWFAAAACRGTDPNLFFAERRGESLPDAKAVCRGCEVRAECLDYAVVSSEKYGIWGGLDERERRPLRQAMRRERDRDRDRGAA